MAARCAVCEGKKIAGIHSRHHPEFHEYQDSTDPGLKPMSAGMRAFRKESGYDAMVKAAKGQPCQIVSPVCTGTAEHIHEILSRGRAGGLKAALRDGETVPACDACNGYVSENPVWAREQGWLISAKDVTK